MEKRDSSKNRAGREERSRCPVFVVGCPRSGTTLLYHMLLSAGGFVYYRAESHVFDVIVPLFRSLESRRTREHLMERWLRSHLFERTGLDAEQIRRRILSDCRNGGDFLRIVMESMAHQQGVDRWADCTPAHLHHMEAIKSAIPDAVFVHVIRDGRDVALSLDKVGWFSPWPWDRKHPLLVAGLRWEWIVRRGREIGQRLGSDYLEVHFEDLVLRPRDTLPRVGAFIGHDLDYDRILEAGVGSVSKPNTSFGGGDGEKSFNPVGRWRSRFPHEELVRLEIMVGGSLQKLGYEPAIEEDDRKHTARWRFMRMTYAARHGLKNLLAAHTPLSPLLADADILAE